MAHKEPLLDVAAALADGTPVDWDSVGQSIASEDDRRLLAELRFIAELALLRIPPGDSSSPVTPAVAAPGRSARPPVAPTQTDAVESWGPLRIMEHVGRGSFGDVYRAWDSRLDREVALKILRRRRRDDEVHASTVIQEGRLLARVRHPNVVTVYGADRLGGQVGLWMEFIRGKTLEQLLREQGPLGPQEATLVGLDVCRALSAVHRAGLLHRDIKPHNVMREDGGRIVLMDLGIGLEREAELDEASACVAGTPVYMAPELFQGQVGSVRSDIYSLGVLLYHLVTHSYPVPGRTLQEVRAKHLREERVLLRDERPDLPEKFVHVIERALARSPEARYESAGAMEAALDAARPACPAGSGEALVTAGTGAALKREPTSWRGWLPSRAAIAVGVLLLAGVASFWAVMAKPEPPVIAVLPFKNLSADADNEYFVDGLTGEIIQNLSVIDGLEVRSLTSSFVFKNKQRNIREVGQQLRANLVVEGSVLRSNEKLRIIAALVRVADDTTLWSHRFDREQNDVFAIQDEISRSIVNELRLKLGRGQRRYNTNLEAYELYLKAVALLDPHFMRRGREAVDLFEQVIAKDPAFAPAYAGLASAWAAMSVNYAGVTFEEGYAKMRPAAEKALQLDPLLAEAHAAMGLVFARDRDWVASEAAFRRAIELNRHLPFIYRSFALWTLFPQGKLGAALDQLSAALSADPLSLDVRRSMAWVELSAGRYDDAIANCRRVLAADPDSQHENQVLARALLQKGNLDEAIAILEKLGAGSQQFLGYAYALSGRRAEAENLAAAHTNRPAREVVIYAGLGDKNRMFDALERMATQKDPRVGAYLTYPELALLRGDPRLAAFRKKLGLPGQ